MTLRRGCDNERKSPDGGAHGVSPPPRRCNAPSRATVRRLRRQQGKSQEALALAAQIDRSYLGAIERGESNATLLNMVKIAAALDATVAELMLEARL